MILAASPSARLSFDISPPSSRCAVTINLSPHTADHTNFGGIAAGRRLNLEIDVLARYLKRMADARG